MFPRKRGRTHGVRRFRPDHEGRAAAADSSNAAVANPALARPRPARGGPFPGWRVPTGGAARPRPVGPLAASGLTPTAREAYRLLVRTVSPTLYREARTLVAGPLIDDLVQETLARAWLVRERFPTDPDRLVAWLIDLLRHVARTAELAPSQTTFGLCLGTEGIEDVADIDAYRRARAIDNALSKLDPVHQELIRRKHVMGQTWVTITREMGFRSPFFAQRAYDLAKAELAKHLDVTPSS